MLRPLRPICPEIPGHALHVVQRGPLRTACFFGEEDCAVYLGWLGRYAASYGCSVHARVVARPGQYHWSSFRVNALGRDDPILSPHAHYCALGRDAGSRRAAYRALFRDHLVAAPPRRARVRVPTGNA